MPYKATYSVGNVVHLKQLHDKKRNSIMFSQTSGSYITIIWRVVNKVPRSGHIFAVGPLIGVYDMST